jgi:hypothetical protein
VRFKLDENLPVELAVELRAMGHDTDTVLDEGLSGEADPAVVNAASAAARILLTLDKGIADVRGYGERVWFYFGRIRLAGEPSCPLFVIGLQGSHPWISQGG